MNPGRNSKRPSSQPQCQAFQSIPLETQQTCENGRQVIYFRFAQQPDTEKEQNKASSGKLDSGKTKSKRPSNNRSRMNPPYALDDDRDPSDPEDEDDDLQASRRSSRKSTNSKGFSCMKNGVCNSKDCGCDEEEDDDLQASRKTSQKSTKSKGYSCMKNGVCDSKNCDCDDQEDEESEQDEDDNKKKPSNTNANDDEGEGEEEEEEDFLWIDCNKSGCPCRSIMGDPSKAQTDQGQERKSNASRAGANDPNSGCQNLCSFTKSNGQKVEFPCHFCFDADQADCVHQRRARSGNCCQTGGDRRGYSLGAHACCSCGRSGPTSCRKRGLSSSCPVCSRGQRQSNQGGTTCYKGNVCLDDTSNGFTFRVTPTPDCSGRRF